jgi:hypothetical protein
MLAASFHPWRNRSRKPALTLAIGVLLAAMPAERCFAFSVLEPVAPTSYEECGQLHRAYNSQWQGASVSHSECTSAQVRSGLPGGATAAGCTAAGRDGFTAFRACVPARERLCQIEVARDAALARCRAAVDRYQSARREQVRRESAAGWEMSQRPRVVGATPWTMTPDAMDRIGRPERQPAFGAGGPVGGAPLGGGGQAFSLPGLMGAGMQTRQSPQPVAPLFGRLGGAAGVGSAAHMFLTAQSQADRLRAVGSGSWGLGAMGLPAPAGLAFGLSQAMVVETALGALSQLDVGFRGFDAARTPVSAGIMRQFESSSLAWDQAFEQQSAAALGLPVHGSLDDPFGNVLQATLQGILSVLERQQARQLEASQAVTRAEAAERAAAEQRRQRDMNRHREAAARSSSHWCRAPCYIKSSPTEICRPGWIQHDRMYCLVVTW